MASELKEVRYEAVASDPTAVWRIATVANHKADMVQQQRGDFQKVGTGLQESMDRVEALLHRLANQVRTLDQIVGRCAPKLRPTEEPITLPDLFQPRELEMEMARGVEDLRQSNMDSIQGIQLMSTPEGNFKFPSPGLSVVVTGWGEDPLPSSSLVSPTWNPNPSKEKVLSAPTVDADLSSLFKMKIEQMEQTTVKATTCTVDGHNADWKPHQILDMTDDEADFHMRQGAFLYNFDAQTLPKSYHCFSRRLMLEYSKFSSWDSDEPFACKFNNPKHRDTYKQVNVHVLNYEAVLWEKLPRFSMQQLYIVGLLWNLPPWPDLSFCEVYWMVRSMEKGAGAVSRRNVYNMVAGQGKNQFHPTRNKQITDDTVLKKETALKPFIPVNFNLYWSLIVICYPGDVETFVQHNLYPLPINRLIDGEIEVVFSKQGNYDLAAKSYERVCALYSAEGWEELLAEVLPDLAECQKNFNDEHGYLASWVKLLTLEITFDVSSLITFAVNQAPPIELCDGDPGTLFVAVWSGFPDNITLESLSLRLLASSSVVEGLKTIESSDVGRLSFRSHGFSQDVPVGTDEFMSFEKPTRPVFKVRKPRALIDITPTVSSALLMNELQWIGLIVKPIDYSLKDGILHLNAGAGLKIEKAPIDNGKIKLPDWAIDETILVWFPIHATDFVPNVTQMLRKHGIVRKFIEFYGEGMGKLSLADRATIANMLPEYGATMDFFPVDQVTLDYLKLTGRSCETVSMMEAYWRANKMLVDYNEPQTERVYPSYLELDFTEVELCVPGLKRPHNCVPLKEMESNRHACLDNKAGFKGFAVPKEQQDKVVKFDFHGQPAEIKHGSVVIAAITSCTNTSNSSVMLGAGLVAEKACELGNPMLYVYCQGFSCGYSHGSRFNISRMASAFNFSRRIDAFQNRACPETEHVFPDAFWEGPDVVINALDNVNAGMYMDMRCLYFQKPLLESGTLGAKCNTQMVLPHLTENYGASRNPPDKQTPRCTVHSFPYNFDYCLTWAKFEFEGLLEKTPTEVSTSLSNPTGYAAASRTAGDAQASDQLERVIEYLHGEKLETFQDCITGTRLKFEELTFIFPEDSTISSGAPFWSAPKQFPRPLEFTSTEPSQLDFVLAASILRAETFGIPIPDWAKKPKKLVEAADKCNGWFGPVHQKECNPDI